MATKVIKNFKLKFQIGGIISGLLSAGKRAETLGKYAKIISKGSKTGEEMAYMKAVEKAALNDPRAKRFIDGLKKKEELKKLAPDVESTASLVIPSDYFGVRNKDLQTGSTLEHRWSDNIPFKQPGGTIDDTAEGTWDKVKYFIPGVGTYYDIKEAYNDPTLRNVATAALSTAGDMFGAGLIGRTAIQGAKWLSRANKLKKFGYVPIDNAGTWMKLAKVGKTRTPAGYITNDIRVVTTLNFPKPTWHGLATWFGGAEPARFVNESFVADRFDNKEE